MARNLWVPVGLLRRMNMKITTCLAGACTVAALLLGSTAAMADGLSDLETFLRQTQQGKTTFTQVVTAPKKAGETARIKTSSGTFEFWRPHRFRFDYLKPFAQTIVADGQTLWLYDADLNQVTARKQQEVLGNTPAALIAGSSDLRALQGLFTLNNAPDAQGQQWVQALPKTQDGQLQSIRLGFRQGQLATLEVLDSFGQQSVLNFGPLEPLQGKVERFQFKPPAGADVVRQ